MNSTETWLAIDLSGPSGTFSIHRLANGNLSCLKEVELPEPYQHSEKLLSALSTGLAALGLSIGQIDRFITNRGPGSFTGLRIAFSTLKGFAMGLSKPIETLSGSEARAIAWSKTVAGAIPYDEVFVLTHVSLQKFIQAKLRVEKDRVLQFEREILTEGTAFGSDPDSAMILIDEKTPKTLVPSGDGIDVTLFPLKAAYLAESLLEATTRKTFSNVEEWIALSPNYFS